MARANEQTLIIERDIARLAEDHQKLNQRFDRHLEIYAQNGKELAGVKVAVDQLGLAIGELTGRADHAHEKQGEKTNDNTKRINQLEIDVSRLASKIAMYASAGSAVASGAISFLFNAI